MSFYTNIFTIETYQAFWNSDRTLSGFRETQKSMTSRLKVGDKLLAYIKGLSRWAAVLRVSGAPHSDRSPLFLNEADPFVIRVPVHCEVALQLEYAIPIRDPSLFDSLTFTRGKENGYWLGPLRRSLQAICESDGQLLERALVNQVAALKPYPIEALEIERPKLAIAKRFDGPVSVVVPQAEPAADSLASGKSERDSIKQQAEVAKLGEAMGFSIWLPRNDRGAVLHHWQPDDGTLLDTLPLNYDDATIGTIEQIDVLWLRGRAIRRAFEVEHTTAIYSGLLRMADLLALQPNMNISLHIVAPAERRDKVLNEIRRPVFSLIENQPLADRCKFIAYEDLAEIMSLPHLRHLSDSVLEEYCESADD